TRFHFRETYEFKRRFARRYGLNLVELTPLTDPGPLYKTDPDRCCLIRKVEPLERAIVAFDAWISAVRQDQSDSRRATELLEYHEVRGRPIVKVFPLARWSRADVWRYIRENGVPYHPLLDQGYSSIGCRPSRSTPAAWRTWACSPPGPTAPSRGSCRATTTCACCTRCGWRVAWPGRSRSRCAWRTPPGSAGPWLSRDRMAPSWAWSRCATCSRTPRKRRRGSCTGRPTRSTPESRSCTPRATCSWEAMSGCSSAPRRSFRSWRSTLLTPGARSPSAAGAPWSDFRRGIRCIAR